MTPKSAAEEPRKNTLEAAILAPVENHGRYQGCLTAKGDGQDLAGTHWARLEKSHWPGTFTVDLCPT